MIDGQHGAVPAAAGRAEVYHLIALLPGPDARNHVPLIPSPRGYPVWWSG